MRPKNWHFLRGLEYPTVLFYKGEYVTLNNYKEHHELVHQAFLPDIRAQKENTLTYLQYDR